MAEYIKREDVLVHKRKMSGADFGGEFWDEAVLCEDIERIPAADVEEVRHEYWLYDGYEDEYSCSYCGEERPREDAEYCFGCGAKMDRGTGND